MSRKVASPTNTSYSGISNYRNDTYRGPMPGAAMPRLPEMDSRAVAKQHYDELQKFLASHLAKEPLNSRSSAREKLTRLTKQQFQELSTDVYDELIRRNNNSETNEVPFLPVRDDFHPKRNQARQKLATLPKTRFKDLSSDVFYELGRRYPEFKEPETPDNGYSQDPPRLPSIDALRGEDSSGRKGSQDSRSSGRKGSGDERRTPNGSLRKPSDDTVRSYGPGRSQSRDDDPPSVYRGTQDFAPSVAPSTATSGMVIPNKSTIAEEEIQVPYGKDDQDIDSEDGSPARPMPQSKRTMSQGLGALGANLLSTPLSPMTDEGEERRQQSEYFDQLSLGRTSVVSTGSVLNGARTREEREAAEQMRSEYEFKIATMQNRMQTLEGELATAKQARLDEEERARRLEKELEELQKKLDRNEDTVRSLEQDLDDARTTTDQSRFDGQKRHSIYEAQIKELQDTIEDMRTNGPLRSQPGAADELRSEVQNLVDELRDLTQRNDELMREKDADQDTIHSLTGQVNEYKRKYEHAKTELRGFKATSQVFQVRTPKTEGSLPFSENGGILDVHVNAFQTAIDNLLGVARSNQPSSVIPPMRNVVNAVTPIADDLRAFEQRPARDRQGLDEESIRLTRERIDATLSNLVAAVKSHATSHGLSPVSLVDAAASHVSAAVVGAINVVMMRNATAAEREQWQQRQAVSQSSVGLGLSSTSPPPPPSKNGYGNASLRSINSLRDSERHGRNPSETSQWSNGGSRDRYGSPVNKGRTSTEPLRRPTAMSDRSSNPSPQPPAIFDTPTTNTNGTSEEEAHDDAWEELRPYLDAQSEAIVLPIRNLLSSMRAGAPADEVNENLSQITTIVTSILSVCNGNLPPASADRGAELLRQLNENCSKLTGLQSEGEIPKQMRQTVASTSLAVAKAVKELRAL